MAKDKASQEIDEAGERVIDLTGRVADAADVTAADVEQAANLSTLRGLGYAAVGVGDLATDAARRLPRLLGHGYLALVARGQRLRMQAGGGEVAEAAQEHAQETAQQATDAARAAGEGAQEAATAAGMTASEAGETVTEGAEETADAVRETGKKAASGGRRAASSAARAATGDTAKGDEDQPSVEDLAAHTVVELREMAGELGIEGRGNMRKQELIDAISDAD
jgi:hypothetical protein